jgi:hypothetical protein
MGIVNRLGTIVKLPDGRIGTTVYNGLDGVGIKWGEHRPNPKDFDDTNGGLFDLPDDHPATRPDFPWYPDAMLRDPYPTAKLPCVGEEFEIIHAAALKP